MAREVRTFACTIPHGTASTAPVTIATTFPPRVVERIDIRVPPGPRGEVGFRIGNRGVQVLPVNAPAWIIDDDTERSYQLVDQPDSGDWSLIGYNTGTYDHTITVSFVLGLTGDQAAAAVAPPPNLTGTEV